MQDIISMLNAIACAGITVLLLWAILDSRFDDRGLVKLGLGVMAVGFAIIAARELDGVQAWDAQPLERCIATINLGLVIAGLGYLQRRRRAGHAKRRATDWADLQDTRPMEHAMPEEQSW